MSGVREAAYNTLVRPQLEYAAAICENWTNWEGSTAGCSLDHLLLGQNGKCFCHAWNFGLAYSWAETCGLTSLLILRLSITWSQYLSQITSNPTPVRPVVAILWHSSKFTQGRTFINIPFFSTGSRSVECPPRKRCQLAKPWHIQGWNWQVAARHALRSQV